MTSFTAAQLCLVALVSLATAQTTTSATLPSISLTWGEYPATTYSSDSSIYLFHNVRFGAKPSRFNTPDAPTALVPDPTGEIACHQVPASALKPTSTSGPSGPPDILLPGENLAETEDCLFLDVYVPTKNFDSQGRLLTQNLPVIVWFYGGAYLFGSKQPNDAEPLYTGQSMLRATGYNAIFVAGNYRVGAFGWLAGNYMESQAENGNAVPNAGLYDQALLLSWVKNYIDQVGGNSSRITAWGESAGASSILHHLVRPNHEPGFQSFITQSPAYQWMWNNSAGGKLDTTFLTFQQNAKCSTGSNSSTFNLTCLQDADEDCLAAANIQLASDAFHNSGEFAVGPAVDSQWIKSIPSILLANGDHFKGITAAIISHVGNEAKAFTPNVTNASGYSSFLSTFFSGDALSAVRTAIAAQPNYQPSAYASTTASWREAIGAIIRDSTFICNARELHDAFAGTAHVYMMAYNFPFAVLALHATDLIPLFMNSENDAWTMVTSALGTSAVSSIGSASISWYVSVLANKVMPPYQAYFGGFAVSTTPAPVVGVVPTPWPTAVPSGDGLSSVMAVRFGTPYFPKFSLESDTVVGSSICSFWLSVASDIEAAMSTKTAAATVPAGIVTAAPAVENDQEKLELKL